MAVAIKGRSTGTTSVELIHESGTVIRAVAPKDNGGDGSAFSPTDLCAAALGSCACIIMTLYAKNHGLPLSGLEFTLVKEMSPSPRRIARIEVAYRLAGSLADEEFERIIATARTCPVRLTLGDGTEVVESFARA